MISSFKTLRHSIKRKLTYVRTQTEKKRERAREIVACVVRHKINNNKFHNAYKKINDVSAHACVEFNAAILLAFRCRSLCLSRGSKRGGSDDIDKY